MPNDAGTPKLPPMQELLRLAQTPQGQQLIALLRAQNGNQLQKIMADAAGGNYAQVKAALQELMQDPRVQSLLQNNGGG